MEFFRNILVGVDLSRAEQPGVEHLSEPTRCATLRAIWLAGQTSGELTFFSATDLPASSQHWLKEENLKVLDESTRTLLDQFAAPARSEGLAAKSQVAHGTAWEEIIRHVKEHGNDLVIVGTRDPGLTSRLLFGSTAMRLLRYCPVPVWVVKPGGDWENLEILVASDLSDVSQAAIDLGVRTARMTGSRLRVLHALEHMNDLRMRQMGLEDEEIRAFHQTHRRDAEQRLNEQLAQTDFRTVAGGVIAEVKEGPAEDVIIETIEEHNIDLVIMGTIARRGLAGIFMGNTAESLLPRIPCSLLAVKPADFESPVS